MLNKKTATGLAAIIAAVSFSAAAQAAGGVDTRILVSNCFNCHGTNGSSVGIIDELDQMPARRIISRMNEYRAGTKPGTIMDRIAKGYSDEEIAAMAKFLEDANK